MALGPVPSRHAEAAPRHPARRARARRLADERGRVGARRPGADRPRRADRDQAGPADRRGGRPAARSSSRATSRAAGSSSRTRSTRLALDVTGARLPRRRRLHGRLHRLPAAARRGAGDRARRRPRAARLGPAQRRAGRGDRAPQRARARPGRAAVRSRASRRSTSPSSRWPRCSRRSRACLAPDGELLALVKPQFELGPGGSARAGWSAIRRPGATRCAPPPAPRPRRGLAVRGFASSGLPGPKGNRETFIHARRGGEALDDVEAAIGAVEP